VADSKLKNISSRSIRETQHQIDWLKDKK
jgi:hypothetical protein